MDGSSDEFTAADGNFMRRQWLQDQMRQRSASFTAPVGLKIFCGSYNMHAKHELDDASGLEKWLCPDDTSAAHIYSVSFQEIVKLNAVNVTTDVNSNRISAYWEETIVKCLNARAPSGHTFIPVAYKQLVGALICVFARSDIFPFIKDVRTASTATGVMGVMGNKGGVIVRFKLFYSTLCFVGGHLAAKRENVAGRNSDFASIMERTCLYPLGQEPVSPAAGAAGKPLLLQDPNAGNYVTIADHDVVFWQGDLNYRIDVSQSLEEILNRCRNHDIEYLLPLDQLNIERVAGRAFQDFTEGRINFLPTYKYIPGTDDYDNRPDKKLRPPAWCDRILWRVRPLSNNKSDGSTGMGGSPDAEATSSSGAEVDVGTKAMQLLSPSEVRTEAERTTCASNGSAQTEGQCEGEVIVKQTFYRAMFEPRISDHKPIAAQFECSLRRVLPEKEKVVFRELVKVLDKMENAGVPKLDVKGLDIDAGEVKFKTPAVSTIRLLNIGFSVAHWKLIPGPSRKFPPWIRLSSRMGMIAPGEAAEIRVSVLFDAQAIRSLDHPIMQEIAFSGLSTGVLSKLAEERSKQYQDMFILRVRNGRDFFVSVSAIYKISDSDFYEMSVEEAESSAEAVPSDAGSIYATASGYPVSRRPPRDVEEGAFNPLVDEASSARSASAERPTTRIGQLKAAAASIKSKAGGGSGNIIGAISSFSLFDDRRSSGGPRSKPQRRASSDF